VSTIQGRRVSMSFWGYGGELLYVDLTTETVKKEDLNRDVALKFIGGVGINTKLAFDLMPPHIDPLNEGNVVLIGAGPLVGTNAPGASKVVATTKLPVSKSITRMTGGGAFARALKFSGYDHLIISGKAKNPSYLEILDDDIKIRDASHLWGKSSSEATELLWNEYDKVAYGTTCSVLSIGQAGENLVKSALTLIDKSTGHLGRGGLGAVLGSKNIKSIVIRGTKGVRINDPGRFMAIVSSVLNRIRDDRFRESYTELGAAIAIEAWANVGMLARDNFRYAKPPSELFKTFPRERYIALKKSTMGCPSCPYQCKSIMELKEGEFTGLVAPINEYLLAVEMAATWDDGTPEKGIKFVFEADNFGIDAYAVIGVAELVCELYEKGLISKDEVDGLSPEPTFEFAMEIMRKIVTKEGVGESFSEGMEGVIQSFGDKARAYAISLKGHLQQLDPRSVFGAAAFGQLTNPRGHQGPVMLTVIAGRPEKTIRRFLERVGTPQEAIERIYGPNGFNVGIDTKYTEDWLYLLDSLGLCRREALTRFYNLDNVAELYSAATGYDTKPSELIKAGERIWNLERLLNVREGFSRKDDMFPEKWLEPLTFGDKELPLMDYHRTRLITKEDLEQLLQDYYAERGWDSEGIPSAGKLKSLGLHREGAFLREKIPGKKKVKGG
jgi:aldehyde:ferredoxin oxidoreductase